MGEEWAPRIDMGHWRAVSRQRRALVYVVVATGEEADLPRGRPCLCFLPSGAVTYATRGKVDG